jgi:4-diphosphocytidyl-2-C-methyl-D-erythritol kinase
VKIYHCPAKINLFLKLTGRRANGYHELQSCFAFLDLFDVLSVEKSENFLLKIDGQFAQFIDEKNNLFTKILDFFAEKFGVSRNLKITIIKNIPVGAGLGGGSSNAAYFMMALNEIFALNLSKNELQIISFHFGSDIAFFFEQHAAIVEGCGEKMTRYNSDFSFEALLIHPRISTSTKDVYKAFNADFSNASAVEDLLKTDVKELLKLPNDLTKPAIATLPLIEEILSELKNCNADVIKMSGSGSACFGVFDDVKKLATAEKYFVQKFPDFFVKKIKILSKPL